MRILVCLKQVPAVGEVCLTENYTLDRSASPQMMNPADESALEAAFRIRDREGGSVTLLSMGRTQAEGMLREAMARGADDAILLSDPAFAGADTLVTARCLHQCVLYTGLYDLILCGRRSIDGETGQVGPMLAAMLDIPCVTNAVKIDFENGTLLVHQLAESGMFIWQAGLPAVVTLCDWSYRLRLPTLKGLRKARSQEIRCFKPEDIGMSREMCGINASPTRVIKVTSSVTGVRSCKMILAKDITNVFNHIGEL